MIIDPYRWNRLPIEALDKVADDTVAVRVRRPRDYHFLAGQYAVVRVTNTKGEQYVRQYSFSSAPHDDQLELLVQHEPDGSASSWVCKEAHPGDFIELSQPFGGFVLGNTKRPVLMIAGRVGIAPFFSMLRSKPAQDTSLLYSVRREGQICYEDELSHYRPTIVVTSHSARIDKTQLLQYLKNEPLVYICGSKQFVDNIATMLVQIGVSERDVKRELFTLQ